MSDPHTTAAGAATALPFVPPSMVVGVLGAGVAGAALLAGEGATDAGGYAVGGAAALGLYVFNRLASVLEGLLSIVRTFVTAHAEGRLPPFRVEIIHRGHVATGDDVELPQPGGHS